MQGRHGRFLAGKATIHSGGQFNGAPPPLSNSQNLGKDQALPPVEPLVLVQTGNSVKWSVT